VQIIQVDLMPLTGVGKIFKPQLRWDAARRVFSSVLDPLANTGVDCEVQVGPHDNHGSIATVTITRVPEHKRKVIANEVDTLLAPFVMRRSDRLCVGISRGAQHGNLNALLMGEQNRFLYL
jgi:fatty-acyl-CoA synthase